MKSRRKPSSNRARKVNTGTLEESSPKNKKSHKIDWAYTVKLPKSDS
jgi:hypothetical protein